MIIKNEKGTKDIGPGAVRYGDPFPPHSPLNFLAVFFLLLILDRKELTGKVAPVVGRKWR